MAVGVPRGTPDRDTAVLNTELAYLTRTKTELQKEIG